MTGQTLAGCRVLASTGIDGNGRPRWRFVASCGHEHELQGGWLRRAHRAGKTIVCPACRRKRAGAPAWVARMRAEREERREQVRRLHGQGLSVRRIAAMIGCGGSTVTEDLRAMGLRSARTGRNRSTRDCPLCAGMPHRVGFPVDPDGDEDPEPPPLGTKCSHCGTAYAPEEWGLVLYLQSPIAACEVA